MDLLMQLIFFVCFVQPSELSVFETNIRFVGGLLSAYALTGDQVRTLSHSYTTFFSPLCPSLFIPCLSLSLLSVCLSLYSCLSLYCLEWYQ